MRRTGPFKKVFAIHNCTLATSLTSFCFSRALYCLPVQLTHSAFSLEASPTASCSTQPSSDYTSPIFSHNPPEKAVAATTRDSCTSGSMEQWMHAQLGVLTSRFCYHQLMVHRLHIIVPATSSHCWTDSIALTPHDKVLLHVHPLPPGLSPMHTLTAPDTLSS